MIHTRTKIVALISLGIFIAALIAYAFFFRMVAEHKENLMAERIRAAEAEMQRKALSQLEAAVASSVEDREKIRKFILEEEDIIEFLSRIETTARAQGVSITTDNLTVSEKNPDFEELQVTLRVEGSFDGVVRMLRILEELPQQSSLTQVGLTRTTKEGEGWQATFDLRVTKFKKT